MKAIGFALCFVTAVMAPGITLTIAEELPYTISATVDEDIENWEFNYQKFLVDPDMVMEPIVVNYSESLSPDDYDLLYIYDPQDAFRLDDLTLSYSVGTDSFSLQSVYLNRIYDVLDTGRSDSTGIRRFAVNAYDETREVNPYREYRIESIQYNHGSSTEVSQIYLYSDSSFSSSQRMMVELEDASYWYWYFDEDSWGENLWEGIQSFFGNKADENRLEAFYSFYVDNWDISEIYEITMRYRQCYLRGYRASIHDNGLGRETFYTGGGNYQPMFASSKDGENSFVASTATGLDDVYEIVKNLYDLEEEYQKTLAKEYVIRPESKSSEGTGFSYSWNSIQTYDALSAAYPDTDFANYAGTHMNVDGEKYWMINFASGIYSFESHSIKSSSDNEYLIDGEKISADVVNEFYSYLQSLYDYGSGGGGGSGIRSLDVGEFAGPEIFYSFEQDYFFDVSATKIKFEENFTGIHYELPCSVQILRTSSGVGGTDISLTTVLETGWQNVWEWLKNLLFSSWIQSNWKWLVGGLAAFILLVILLKEGSKKERRKKK